MTRILAKGIDVSKYQGVIDWEMVKKSGVKFAMIREGYGIFSPSQKDSYFEVNYKRAKGHGIDVGAYHYSYAKSTDEAIQEAKFCLKNIAGKQFEYPIAFDIEDRSLLNLSVREKTDICRAFCQILENAGYYAMIYCNFEWFKNQIDGAELARKYDIWLAQWSAKSPKIECGIWQYSENGGIAGINGGVDLDYAYKNYPEIMRRKGLNGFKKGNENTPTFFEYTIEKGDTLWGLAEKFLGSGTEFCRIQALNNLKNDKIFVGQRLKIPK